MSVLALSSRLLPYMQDKFILAGGNDMYLKGFNPILPLDEYIPDGEPHVFGERIYLFGSHDTEGGLRYCAEENYVGYRRKRRHGRRVDLTK